MNSALRFLLVALVGVVFGQTVESPVSRSNQTSFEVVKKWTQDIVLALNAEPFLHSELLLHIDENTKIIYPDETFMGGVFKGIEGYWNFVQRLLLNFQLSDKNFALLKVEPSFFRSLISANFKIKSLPLEGQQQQQSLSSNWKGQIVLQFDVSGKLTHMIFINENIEQSIMDLRPRSVQLLNSLVWKYFQSDSPLTLQSDFWSLVDDNLRVTFKNLPRQLLNESVVTGKQQLFDKMQTLERLCHPEGQSQEVRSFMQLMFHYKFDVDTLLADENTVLSKVLWGKKTQFLTLHTFNNQKLVSVDITFLQLVKPWNVLPMPSTNINMQRGSGSGLVNTTCQFC